MNELLLMRRVASAKPYDAEIEYLKSTGTQWIDTGIYASNNLKTEIGLKIDSNDARKGVYGCFTSSKYYYIYTSGGKKWQLGYGGSYVDRANVDTSYHDFVFDDFKVYIDNNLAQSFSSSTFTGTYTQTVFSMHNASGGVYSGIAMKLYYLRMYDGAILIRDMIPVRSGQTGYLYDKVSGQLFGNAGTGSFILGSDV